LQGTADEAAGAPQPAAPAEWLGRAAADLPTASEAHSPPSSEIFLLPPCCRSGDHQVVPASEATSGTPSSSTSAVSAPGGSVARAAAIALAADLTRCADGGAAAARRADVGASVGGAGGAAGGAVASRRRAAKDNFKNAAHKKKGTKEISIVTVGKGVVGAKEEVVELPAKRSPTPPSGQLEPKAALRTGLPALLRAAGCALALVLLVTLLVCGPEASRPAVHQSAQDAMPHLVPERRETIVDPLLSIESGLGCNVAEMEPEPEADVPQNSYEAFQDAMEGVSGLVRRLERLQPLLGRPGGGHEAAAEESRLLRQRFAELLKGLRSAGASGESLVSRAQELGLFAFHRDLALLVGRIEGQLGLAAATPAPLSTPMPVPAPAAAVAQLRLGSHKTVAGGSGEGPPPGPTPLPGRPGGADKAATRGERAPVGAVSPDTAQRVHLAMSSIVTGMQRFEALQPQVRLQPDAVVGELARRGQQLDEVLFALQRRGRELENEGRRPVHETDGGRYAQQLEALAEAQAGFLRETEERLLDGDEALPVAPRQTSA